MPEGPDTLAGWRSCSRLLALGLSATKPGTATTVKGQNTEIHVLNLFLFNQYKKWLRKSKVK